MRKFVCSPLSIKSLVVAALVATCPAVVYGQSADEDLRLETDVDGEIVVAPSPGPLSAITIGDDDAPAPRRRRVEEDAYAATGVDLGAFQFFPTLEIGTVTTSNVGRNTTKDADFGLRLRPGFRLESDWVRHQLNVSGSADVLRYLENEDLAATSASLGSSFRLDIRRDTRADFTLDYGLTSTGAESTEVPDTASGARIDQTLGVSAAVTHDMGPMENTFKLAVVRNMFGDVTLNGGGMEDNSDRDFTEISAGLRGTLNNGGWLKPFAEVAYEPRLHDKKTDRAGIKRNSHGLRMTAGVTLDDDPIWSGEIGLTAQWRDYADGSLDSTVAPGIAASVNWRPTDLTRFEFNSGVSLSETVAAGASATRSWTGGYTGTHSFRDNLDLIGGLDFTYSDGSAGDSLSMVARLGLAYDVNPVLSLTAGYQGTWVRGFTAAGDYNEQQLLTSIILKR